MKSICIAIMATLILATNVSAFESMNFPTTLCPQDNCVGTMMPMSGIAKRNTYQYVLPIASYKCVRCGYEICNEDCY